MYARSYLPLFAGASKKTQRGSDELECDVCENADRWAYVCAVYSRSLVLEGFPGEDVAQAVEPPEPEPRQMGVSRAIVQVEGLTDEALASSFCRVPEILQLLCGLV